MTENDIDRQIVESAMEFNAKSQRRRVSVNELVIEERQGAKTQGRQEEKGEFPASSRPGAFAFTPNPGS